MSVPNNSDRKFDRILEGIQYLIGDNRRLREDLGENARQAAEDRKQAAEDRKQAAADREQAAEDRRDMKELIRGIRQALVIIGRRGGEFVEIQKQQGAQIRKLTELTEKNTGLLQAIHKTLRAQRNGKSGNGRSRA